MGTFGERIERLADAVGDGVLTGNVEVDQVYAEYQERGADFNHPRGGQAFYLRDSLYDDLDEHMRTIARRTVTPDGSEITDGMADAMEAVSTGVERRAPREYDDLRHSGHPTVASHGENVYDREPRQRRLTEQELKDKHRGDTSQRDRHGRLR